VTTIESVEPATEAVRARFESHSSADVAAAIAAADAAFRSWRTVPIPDRAIPLKALARVLRDRRDRYAHLITTEMGKPITEALAEIEKCAWTCDFYADHAGEYLADLRRAFRDNRVGSLRDMQDAYREGHWTTIDDPGRSS